MNDMNKIRELVGDKKNKEALNASLISIIDGKEMLVEPIMSTYGKVFRLEKNVMHMQERRNINAQSKRYIYWIWAVLNPTNGLFWIAWPACMVICGMLLPTVTDCIRKTIEIMICVLVGAIILTVYVKRQRNRKLKDFS